MLFLIFVVVTGHTKKFNNINACSLYLLYSYAWNFHFIAEFKNDSEVDMSDVKRNLERLYEYNLMLREKLVAGKPLLHSTSSRHSSEGNSDKGGV